MVSVHTFVSALVAAFVVGDAAIAQNAPMNSQFQGIMPKNAAQGPYQGVVVPSKNFDQVPVTPAPTTTVPVTTVPATTVPATTVPATTVPATTVPATTVPVTTPAPGPTIPNWVGPMKGKPIDNACYRKSYITKNKLCGPGYDFDKVATCWAQCPIEYPVECGMECLPQNADCTKAILRKILSVGNVALNAATSGLFGSIQAKSKGIQTGVKCGQQLFGVVEKALSYLNEVEGGGANVDTTKDQLVFLVMKADFAVYDLPVAVTTCLGMPTPTGLDKAKELTGVVQTIVQKIIEAKGAGENLLKPATFVKFISSLGVGKSVASLSPGDADFLKQLVGTGVKCGTQIKGVVDKVVSAVAEFKKTNPTSPVDVVKFAILNSEIVMKDVPDATVGCFDANAPAGFKTRDDVIKVVHTIIDRVVEASSQNGNPVSVDKYAITIANMGLDAIAMFDPTGIAAMAAEFVQPICGPTAYIGDIDDGPADKALGLTTVQKAFRDSTGSWLKTGNGQLRIVFRSVDDKDVKVNIKSGGDRAYQVKVGKGQTVEWSKPLSEFVGKTLYMDRWRPGFLGIPGTGGGSLLAWVPNDNDGQLQLEVKINPTSFRDKDRRSLRQ